MLLAVNNKDIAGTQIPDAHAQVESGENMIFLKYIFDFVFHWKGIYYGQLYYKTCLGILISPPKPQKTAKNVDF